METNIDRRAFDRRLYLAASILFPLLMLVGFGRTYYLKAVFGTPPLSSGLVHVHGILMTAWILLFIAQIRLVATKRLQLHRQLGYAAIALAVLMVVVGVPTALRAAKYGAPSNPAGIPPLGFLVVPLFDLLMFVGLFAAAISYRRQPAAHKRLMLLTAINFLPPALGRIHVASLVALGPLWFFGFPTLLALLCLGLDRRRHGRVNPAFATGTGLLVASYVIRLALLPTSAWLSVATWLTSFV